MGPAQLRGPAGCDDGEIHGGHRAEDALDNLGPDSLSGDADEPDVQRNPDEPP